MITHASNLVDEHVKILEAKGAAWMVPNVGRNSMYGEVGRWVMGKVPACAWMSVNEAVRKVGR